MGYLFRKDLLTTISLFNTLIKPILLYASDFWGCLKLPNNNPILNVQMRIYKDLLGVQRQTTNVGVFLELGEIPLSIHAKRNCINNYFRIKVDNKVNPLTALVLMSLDFQEHGWLSMNEDLLRGIGINVLESEKLCQDSLE